MAGLSILLVGLKSSWIDGALNIECHPHTTPSPMDVPRSP